jgi:putative transposase-like DNA-binding protein
VKKSRFLHLDPKVNPGKIAALEALQAQYTAYLWVCVAAMLAAHKFSIALKDKQAFFPACPKLSSQIVKNVRDHAISIVSGWAASKYTTKLKSFIKGKFNDGEIDEATRSALYILGKRLVDKPSGKVTQAALDLYWSWLLDEEVVGKTPSISSRCGMRMSEMTAVLSISSETKVTQWWLGFSHLQAGKARIQLPLAASPYVKDVTSVSKGVLARKTKQGRWRFEVVEKAEWEVPKPAEGAPRIGVDVGLNVMAATSSGELLGASLKPKFNSLYGKVKAVRANRQRQGFKENSPRLDKLEAKLTGAVKTMAGEVANKLVEAHPGAVFIVEDLDLRGCRGAKRFAYRALHHNLNTKAPCEVVNPAYSSQMCPSCGYVSRSNRSDIKFICRGCGRKSHADVVGGINLLGRSEDKQVGLDDHPSAVKALLRERYRLRRDSSSGGQTSAPVPSGRRLTTRAPHGSGTASNQVVAS